MDCLEQDHINARSLNGLKKLFNFSLAAESGSGPRQRGNRKKGGDRQGHGNSNVLPMAVRIPQPNRSTQGFHRICIVTLLNSKAVIKFNMVNVLSQSLSILNLDQY
jgi:hypothetical protein